jgi:large subunit ribosomal protein L16
VRQSQHLQLSFLPLAAQTTLQHAPAQLQQSRRFQLMPRRMKYRKAMKRMTYNHTIVPNTRQLAYGTFGIRAITPARVPAKTIEAIRRALRRKIKKTAKLWIRVAATVPITKKPAEIRMGKGKGAVDHYACIIRPGSIVFEMDRVSKTVALQALDSISYKCPFKVGFVEWN